MKSRLLSFIQLPANEKVFFFHSLLLLSKYRLRLKTVPLEKLVELVHTESTWYQNREKVNIDTQQVSRLVQVAARFVPFSTCLSNALAGKILFASAHHPTTLHIGARNTPEKGFEAHAWLTLDGTILLGHLPDLESYKELPPLYQKKP